MRIVGGSLRGRKIDPPISMTTRPMTDRAREGLFNILAHREWGTGTEPLFETPIHVLDAFCGTGALAFEALSRGAAQATLFDKDPSAAAVARQNAEKLGVAERCLIMRLDTLRPTRASAPCQLIFLAQPHRSALALPAFLALREAGWVAPHALLVVETASHEPPQPLPACEIVLDRAYGALTLHFMVCQN